MKKILVLTFLAIGTVPAFAQDKGIQFEHNKSWKQILAKAKAERKLIMVDCYTTWCGPCKLMTKKTFNDEKTGAFYNKHFINVKMQLDSTKNDSKEIRARYADAGLVNRKYQIDIYPTVLFLDAEGNVMDRRAGYIGPTEFITAGKAALEPNERLALLIKKFKKNPDDETIIAQLIARKDDLDRETMNAVFDKYMATGRGELTTEKMSFVFANANYTTDRGFKYLQEHVSEVDKLAGKGTAASTVSQVIIKEEVVPLLMSKQGNLNAAEWASLKKKIGAKYPAYVGRVMMLSKLNVVFSTVEMDRKVAAAEQFINEYSGQADTQEWAVILNEFASDVAHRSNDARTLDKALGWSKKAVASPGLADSERSIYTNIYASLLYKTGKKAEAIKAEKEAIALAQKIGDQESIEAFNRMLKRMEKGESDIFGE